jgi:CubicO group peptidase (beta-lactamase class C family)
MNFRVILLVLFSCIILCLGRACYSPPDTNTNALRDNPLHHLEKQIATPWVNAWCNTPETEAFEAQVRDFLKQWEIHGASLAVVRKGKLVYMQGFGYADKEQQILMQPYHQLRIASVSKLFTAVAIMQLVEQGKLTLNDNVFGKDGLLHSPPYQSIADTLAYSIEVEHLLTHTAGWRNIFRTDPMFVPVLVGRTMNAPTPTPFEHIVRFMLSQRGMFQPGTLYDYSNFGYCLLGKIIESQTNTPYQQYMFENILKPLGIQSMQIGKNRYNERFANEVKYYSHRKALKNLSIYHPSDSADRAYEGTNTEMLGAAGGWIATAVDVARFVNAIDGFDTSKDILNVTSIRRMTQKIAKDSTQKHLIGWKQVDEEKWWRTGSLESTSISVTRRHDQTTWVFVTNTGSWRGPFFVYEIEGLLRRGMQNISTFPDWDLFDLKYNHQP